MDWMGNSDPATACDRISGNDITVVSAAMGGCRLRFHGTIVLPLMVLQ